MLKLALFAALTASSLSAWAMEPSLVCERIFVIANMKEAFPVSLEPQLSSSGRYLVLLDSRLQTIVRDLSTGNETVIRPAAKYPGQFKTAFSPDETRLAFAEDQMLSIYDVATGSLVLSKVLSNDKYQYPIDRVSWFSDQARADAGIVIERSDSNKTLFFHLTSGELHERIDRAEVFPLRWSLAPGSFAQSAFHLYRTIPIAGGYRLVWSDNEGTNPLPFEPNDEAMKTFYFTEYRFKTAQKSQTLKISTAQSGSNWISTGGEKWTRFSADYSTQISIMNRQNESNGFAFIKRTFESQFSEELSTVSEALKEEAMWPNEMWLSPDGSTLVVEARSIEFWKNQGRDRESFKAYKKGPKDKSVFSQALFAFDLMQKNGKLLWKNVTSFHYGAKAYSPSNHVVFAKTGNAAAIYQAPLKMITIGINTTQNPTIEIAVGEKAMDPTKLSTVRWFSDIREQKSIELVTPSLTNAQIDPERIQVGSYAPVVVFATIDDGRSGYMEDSPGKVFLLFAPSKTKP